MAGAYQSPQTKYAIQLVLAGMSIVLAAREAGIHRTTLSRALNPKKKKKIDKRSVMHQDNGK